MSAINHQLLLYFFLRKRCSCFTFKELIFFIFKGTPSLKVDQPVSALKDQKN
jgi:hypothetical protein